VHDPVCDENIGNDDFGGVDEYGAVFNGDGYDLAVDGL